MVQNDIYKSRERYESFLENLHRLTVPPPKTEYKRKYYCRNGVNLKYFKKLCPKLALKDLSYVRRLTLMHSLRFISHHTQKDLSNLDRDDIDGIVISANETFPGEVTKRDFKRNLKYLWRLLFPEKDEKGRIDETTVPYTVRHIKTTMDKSREKRKRDRLTLDEYEQIVAYFSADPRMQAYLSLALESLARPQELLYLRIRDVQHFDDFAKIYVSEHGKEGVKLLQCENSYPYLMKWLSVHPNRKKEDAFLFTNNCGSRQLTPYNINKKLKIACKNLGLDKPITCYSLKRNGITFRRLRGESDVEIQHAAGWTSTRQLQTYDQSTQEDAYMLRLLKKGKIGKDHPRYQELTQRYELNEKECSFCNTKTGFTEEICPNCLRPLDREKLKEQMEGEGLVSVKQMVKELLEDRTLLETLKGKLNEIG